MQRRVRIEYNECVNNTEFSELGYRFLGLSSEKKGAVAKVQYTVKNPASPYNGNAYTIDIIYGADYPFRLPQYIFSPTPSHSAFTARGRLELHRLGIDVDSPACTASWILMSIPHLFSEADEHIDDIMDPELLEALQVSSLLATMSDVTNSTIPVDAPKRVPAIGMISTGALQ